MSDIPPQKRMKSKKDKHKKSKIYKKEEIMKLYLEDKNKYLYFDVFVLFALSLSYSAYLIYIEFDLGMVFLIFTFICCAIIALAYNKDLKEDIRSVEKDLEILFK